MTLSAQRRGITAPIDGNADFRTGGRQERLSVTVPRDLAAYVRAAAPDAGGQSAVVTDALRLHRREIRRLQTALVLELNGELDLELAEEGVRTGAPID